MGIQDSRVVGLPLVNFTDTKANLLAIASPEDGMTAFAEDTGELGFYTQSAWHWWNPDSVNHLIFDTSPTGVPSAEGVVSWHSTDKTLSLDTGLGPVMQVGQELFVWVYNGTGATIPNGSALYPVGAVGEVPSVGLANASIETTITGTILISTMDIPDSSLGLATQFGKVRDIDTTSWTYGMRLYVSDTVDGELTSTRPSFPSYAIVVGGVIKSHATEGALQIEIIGSPHDTFQNAWNGSFRESIRFWVESNGTTVTGYLEGGEAAIEYLTLLFSDGMTVIDVDPPWSVALTAGTDSNPQTNFVYIPRSTKLLTASTSDWPTSEEHVKVATIVLRSAATTELDGALRNQNWNDHVQEVMGQGHLAHIGERIRQEAAKWDSGVAGSVTIDATPTPDDVWAKVTGGVVYQMHRQVFPIIDMTQYGIDAVSQGSKTFTLSGDGDLTSDFPAGRIIKVNGSTGNDGLYTVASTLWSDPNFVITVEEAIPDSTADGTIGDDIHIVNDPVSPYQTTTNLNTETDDATGTSLANRSFAFVVWGVANKSGTVSHLMLNLPTGSYSRLAPENALNDADNYSVYDIPKAFQGVGFLIARFIFQLDPTGNTWTLYSTEDLRGKVPNTAAGGGGGGGGGADTFLELTDTPSAYAGAPTYVVQVNAAATALEFSNSYVYGPGRAGGQTVYGDTDANGNLVLGSTAHATKGSIILGTQSAYVESTDRLGLGTLAPDYPVHAVVDGGGATIAAQSYGVNAQVRGIVAGGTKAAPAATPNDTLLLSITGRGHDGTAFTTARVRIGLQAAELWTATNQGTRITWAVTPTGSTTIADAMTLASTGLGLATTTFENWHTDFQGQVLQIGDYTTVGTFGTIGSYFMSNCYYDDLTTWLYQRTDGAAVVGMDSGRVWVRVAPSGTADTAITWTDAIYVHSDGEIVLGDSWTRLGTVTVHGGTSGASTAHTDADDFVIEGNTEAGLSIITANGGYSVIALGHATDLWQAGMYWHSGSKVQYIGTRETGAELWLHGGNLGTMVRITGGSPQVVGIGPSGLFTPSGASCHVYRNATMGAFPSITVGNAGLRVEDNTLNLYMDGNAIVTDGTTFSIGTMAAGSHIALGLNGTEVARLDDTGLGIGVTPLAPLHIYRPGATGAAVLFNNGNSGGTVSDGLWVGYSDRAYVWNYEATALVLGTFDATVCYITDIGMSINRGLVAPTEDGLDVLGAIWSSTTFKTYRAASGGWARGLHVYESLGSTVEEGGIGLYGSGATNTRIYLAWGDNPYGSTTGLFVLPTGYTGILVQTPNEALEVKGRIVARDPQNNPAFIVSPSSGGYGVDPELYIQSSESSTGTNANFHISRNARYQTSDDTYRAIDTAYDAVRIMFTSDTIIFSHAPAAAGALSFADLLSVDFGDEGVGIGWTSPSPHRLKVVGKGTIKCAYFHIDSGAADDFIIWDEGGGGGRVFAIDSGNYECNIDQDDLPYWMGIGRSNPLDRVHVQGAVLREGWFCGYAATQTGFTGARTDIDIDTEVRKDGTWFTHSVGSDNITVVKTGWYRISYSIDYDSDLTDRQTIQTAVFDDGVVIAQSYSYCYLRYSTYGFRGTCANSFLAYIVAGSIIDVRTYGQAGSGAWGSGCSYGVLQGSQITIERVDA